MSYLVLARKYRPQTFADLVGQEQVSRTLKNALTTGRVAHAYLFSGPRGVGKTTAARLLAMSLSCLKEDVAERPCGECANCLEIQSGQAVDVVEVDGASNRGINEIRDLRETVKYLPAKSRYKVYIIDEVHALTKDAFNALLKTLEEPPPHVVFIFATTETHKVLPTILSRCQRYDFRRIRVEDIAGRLAQVAEMENIQAEPEALELIARQAEGGLRDSLSLMDQAIAAGGGLLTAEDVRRSLGLIDQGLIRRLISGTLGGNAAEALAVLDEAYLRGYDFKDLGLKSLEYVRGLTLIKVDAKNASLMNITEAEEADFGKIAADHSLETLNRHFDAWLKLQRELSYNQQPRWLMEAHVISLSQLAPLVPVSELVARLGKLLAANPPARPASGAASPVHAQFSRPVPPVQAEPAESLEAAASPVLTEPSSAGDNGETPPATWPEFCRRYKDSLDAMTKAMLTGAKAEKFGQDEVSLLLGSKSGLCTATEGLLRAQLMPLLQKVFGRNPRLIFEQEEDPSQDLALLEERLEEVKNSPEAAFLSSSLPGRFTEFKLISASAEEAAVTEEDETDISLDMAEDDFDLDDSQS